MFKQKLLEKSIFIVMIGPAMVCLASSDIEKRPKKPYNGLLSFYI